MKKIVVFGTLLVSLIHATTYAGERLSLGYIYSTSKSHTEIVESTKGSISVVSPTTFNLKVDGTLEIDEISDVEFVFNMHKQGVKVTPFLSNHWGQKRAEAALDHPETLIRQLIDAIELYNYDGVNVDLENLKVSYKDKLTEFMRLLREALPQEKTLSIAVAANPEKLSSTWIAAYDYRALAEVVDYLVLMAYDEHCYGGAEGPVASIGFVEKSLQSILDEVSRDKVVLGMPLYGRVWQEGKDIGGEAVIMAQMPRIIKQYKLVPKYDLETQTPVLTLTIGEGVKGPYVNGAYLEEGTYHIYYENENSMKAKLSLINQYDILGGALWAIDNESSDLWDYYFSELNAIPYESDKEIRLREKYEYAVKTLVGEPEVAFIAIHTIDIREAISCQKVENLKIDFSEKTEKIQENLNEDLHIVKKIKHFKIKRYMVRLNKELRLLEKYLSEELLAKIERCKKQSFKKNTRLIYA